MSNLENLSPEEKLELQELLQEKDRRQRYSKIDFFRPYPWQRDLANCTGFAAQILAMCANQIGKTTTGAYITACHLTGKYPDWWEGHQFVEPIQGWACGVSNETTRDILQYNMLGTPGDPEAQGTMFVPRLDIISTTRKPQVPNAVQTVLVKHYNSRGEWNGNSRLDFKAYEQGEEKFMGRPMDWIWLDEQPPDGIYTQCITRTVSSGGFVMMTFTPEDGRTPTIHQFMEDIKPGQYLLTATWEDAPHLSEERKEQLLAQYSPHEREMRSRGIPFFGSGLVFPISDDKIIIDPFVIPQEWPRIIGIDFGWEHPTAAVWCAWDNETDTFYVYDEYREKHGTPQTHAVPIKAIDARPIIVWPHDGLKHDPGSGTTLADLYRAQGLNMAPDHFRNPPAPNEKGKGTIRVEPGIMAMLDAMSNGQFKVFSNCQMWFQEKRGYHRDDGVIVALDDDLMSATRYAYQSRKQWAKPISGGTGYSRYQNTKLPIDTTGIV